jgi:transcriptional regulator GlxA family with amidase domain
MKPFTRSWRNVKKNPPGRKYLYMRTQKIIGGLLCILISASDSRGQSKTNDSLARRQQEMIRIINTKPKADVKTIGIFLYDGYQTLDAMGPYEVLSQLPRVKIFFVAKEKGLVSNQKGMKVQVDKSIAEIDQLDILVVPGGAAETFLQTQDSVVLNWIRHIDKGSVYTTSVCTGAWILGAANLLKGKNATTNWYRAEEMLQQYGALFKNERWVKDGKYWTSAGVTAGLDMSLAMVNELMGVQYTQGVMLNLEYDPSPPIQGGSPEKTEPIVKDMMLQMYDMGLQPLFKKYSKK